jgi:DNA polymerase III sliding clamp (beta) subunit (PCNA family)
MKFKDKTVLLPVLDIIKPAVSTKDFDSTMKCFHFMKDGIEGYNGEIYIKVNIQFTEPMDFLVPADTFYKLISNIPNSVEFDILMGKSSVTVKVGSKIEAKFPLVAEYKFPCKSGGEAEGKSFPLSKEVLEGLKICLEFIGKDETKPVYRGVYINPEGVFASDGYRIAHFDIGFSGEVFLPEAFCNLLLKHEPKEFLQFDGYFQFYTPEILVVANKMEIGESLPNYLSIINSAKESSQDRFISVNSDMVDACKRVSIFSEGLIDKYCGIKFDGKAVTITVKNTNIGEITEKFGIGESKYNGEEITVDLFLFQSILEHSKAFELSPETEDRPFPVIRGVNNKLEIIQITLNVKE